MEYINYQTQDQWQGPASQQSPIDIVLEQTTPRPLADQPLTVSFVGDQALTRDPRSSGDQFIGAGTLTLGNHHYHFSCASTSTTTASTCLMASGKTPRSTLSTKTTRGKPWS